MERGGNGELKYPGGRDAMKAQRIASKVLAQRSRLADAA
jgi:hypothetical protein